MHWTYDEWASEDDLEQGDLLAPTEELRQILDDVHPHFCDDKYLAFCVATQCCDLARHGGKPAKARYITIATVRSLKQVIPKLLHTVAKPVATGVFRKSAHAKAEQLLERLFDQNEQALGLFYLHPDAGVGLGESAVAFLRVTVALRGEHYPILLRARRGRLKPAFRAKFGWLLGNLYARAATPDWADAKAGKQEVKRLISDHMREQLPGNGPLWVDDVVLDAATGKLTFDKLERSTLLTELENYRPDPPIEQLVDEVLARLGSMTNPADDQRTRIAELMPDRGIEERLDALRVRLRDVGLEDETAYRIIEDLKGAVPRNEFLDLVEGLVATPHPNDADFQRKFGGRLRNSGRLKKLVK